MTVTDAGFVGSGVMLATAIMDAVRGRSGLGKYRLTKERSPDRFWMAVVLYFNMAFLLFWASGRALEAAVDEEPQEHTVTFTIAPGEPT
ncbi:hypothetical protein [Aurantiacibacter sp. D1-12]|uniref:hypothetical protein n=1 Tax=Aurantiacibacter sp. D1-12 TaxID=2993658 RepID=UPI00237CF9F4|nr:hypothetical protein [Aurantiacibacter sp. D1-12]MDE1467707.1 hypothetical protein [Aurantiacibacter sp. D1-12]